ncbi:hypothetical protein EJ08DRAFT_676832 [Tothia fuscella]|uniref:Uncharacterized protein n=1 Tax=Tothia fuscella TaxID=1048955 RepID=A0A9P4NX27_9PEZI|nr:hypothetical protein EJ08DRAFT_676832 [Tothia fuscella]
MDTISNRSSTLWSNDEKSKSTPTPTYTLRSRIYCKITSFLSKISFPIAILLGCAITGGTTYALVRWVQHLIATAKVNADPVVWMQEARHKAYDACYYGCSTCSDAWWAYNACAMTAKANVTGIMCDGNKLWNWKDRYPLECLHAVGEFYKADALGKLKKNYRNRLAIVILTVLAGVVGSILVYAVWKKYTRKLNEAAQRHRTSSIVWTQKSTPQTDFNEKEYTTSTTTRHSGSTTSTTNRKLALLTSLAIFTARPTNAYSCAGYSKPVNQYFVNGNHTIYGVIHGYLSNCYDYTCNCSTVCSGGSMPSCSTICSTCTGVDVVPRSYVNRVLPKVQSCGFKVVDAVGGDVNLRVANAGIERNWWVMIRVNKYNLTEGTDEGVECLHAIGG